MFRKYVTYDQDFPPLFARFIFKTTTGLGQIDPPPAFLLLMAFTLVIFKKKNK